MNNNNASTIRLSRSVLGDEEKNAVMRVLDKGFLGMGSEVQAFEQELATFIGTDRPVHCVNTGTSALHLAVEALGIGPGDEVLVPSITYVASFQAVAATGATAVACDVRSDSVYLDVEDAARRVTPRTRAIMPVHYASNVAGVEDVYHLARAKGLRVIEDAAHAFGCRRGNEMVGSTGDIVCFSFDGIKNITSGEGGAVVTGDADIAQYVATARLLGVENDTQKRFSGERSWVFDVLHQGHRHHMSDIMAAIGRAQLKKIGHFGATRRELATGYAAAFGQVEGLTLFDFDYSSSIPHIFPLRVRNGKRDGLMDHLRASGIQCGLHYGPNHLLSYFKTEYALPTAEKLGRELISLPLHPMVSLDDQQRVVTAVQDYLHRHD
ncbi:DegT/DnrJ/EryC1/StrS family aminotransferase [Devosia sp.]|jgi:dTDP-4-amino-4,6-dideoxygalactose transaminase|uniref:DegT/DnrJ/EryC1/StrS family aminotransferase n=1 Tax=Devosia sp. TaxID=1871048 RepID=UPI003EEA498E